VDVTTTSSKAITQPLFAGNALKTERKPALSVLVLSDGRPGRFRRSETILNALNRSYQVDTSTIEVPAFSAMQRKLLRLLDGRPVPAGLFKRVCGIDPQSYRRPDLLVSSGGNTLYPSMMLARHWRIPNIFSGDRKIYHEGIDLVLTMNPDNAHYSNTEFVLNSVAVDPRKLPSPSRPAQRVGVLVGGSTDEIVYDADDWLALFELAQSLSLSGLETTLVTSPRTPDIFYNLLDDRPLEFDLIDFRTKGPGSIDDIYELDGLVVTIDSTSMVVESVCARRPVCVVTPSKMHDFKDRPLFERLAAENRIHICNGVDKDMTALTQRMNNLTSMTGDALAELADVIEQRIGERLRKAQ